VKYEEQSGYSLVALEKVIMTMENCVPKLLANVKAKAMKGALCTSNNGIGS
jgi:hypothetical protein